MESSDIDNDMVEPSGSALFRRCDPDPQGSVSKAWSLTILLILLFFGFAIFESYDLSYNGASEPLIIASIWTIIVQICTLAVGTFIIKRFSTPFSVGFLLGLVVFVAQQNLMLSVTFWHTQFGSSLHNIIFANLSFALFVVYSFFAAIMHNYRQDIMVAPVDAPGFGKKRRPGTVESQLD